MALKNTVARRPTETVSAAAAIVFIAGLLAHIIHVDQKDLVIYITAVLGALPTVITYLVELVRGA